MNREDRELRRNGEGYLDLTAYYAIKRADGKTEERKNMGKTGRKKNSYCGRYETGKSMTLPQYKKHKLKILDELCVKITDEEKAYLQSLRYESDVDRYARKLIMRGD